MSRNDLRGRLVVSQPSHAFSKAVPRRFRSRESPSSAATRSSATARSDEALFEAHVAGDLRAFRELFSRHAPRIHSVLRQRGLGEADARDVVQQTFLLAHQARRDYSAGLPMRPWLWTIAFNLVRKGYRRHQRARRAVESLTSQAAIGLPTQAALDDEHALRIAIQQLSSIQQEVILLHWYEGLSFREIAAIVHASESAVKVRAHRAYQRLREILEGLSGELP
jgi:RNA polymerase sigma factor (sigma-70 family)